MKAGILTLLVVLLTGSTINAQSAYQKEDLTLAAGLGFGVPSYYGSVSGFGIPLHAHFEYGFHEYISAGPQLGYARYSYDYLFDQYDYTYTFTQVGIRGAFHYLPLLEEMGLTDLDTEKMDFYLLLNMGLEWARFKADFPSSSLSDATDNRFYLGPSLGFKYFLSQRMAGYLETGTGQNAWARFGVAVRL